MAKECENLRTRNQTLSTVIINIIQTLSTVDKLLMECISLNWSFYCSVTQFLMIARKLFIHFLNGQSVDACYTAFGQLLIIKISNKRCEHCLMHGRNFILFYEQVNMSTFRYIFPFDSQEGLAFTFWK